MPHRFVLRDSSGRDNPIGEATAIGRDAACQIVLTGDSLVSRRHALVWVQDEAVYVRDENLAHVGEKVKRHIIARRKSSVAFLMLLAHSWTAM